MTCRKSEGDHAAVMFLPLLDVPGSGLVAFAPEFELEREACDEAEHLARCGFGTYGGAVPVVSNIWLATDGELAKGEEAE